MQKAQVVWTTWACINGGEGVRQVLIQFNPELFYKLLYFIEKILKFSPT